MNKSFFISILGGWITLGVVVVLMFIMWFQTTPKLPSEIDPSLTPLALDSISDQSVSELNSMIKNGNLPVTVDPSNIGRDNPFSPY